MRIIFTFLIAVVLHFSGNASELYIRVNASGEYFASVSTQTHYNANNIFKFFDLPGGIVTIQVFNRMTNAILYNGSLSLKNNERIVAQIDGFGQLTIIQRVQIQELNWYTTIANTDGYPNNPYPNPTNPYPGNQAGNAEVFQKFMTSLKNESIDGNKLTMAKSFVKSNSLSADQIAQISRQLSFDSNRLEFAKYAYDYCFDKSNYFLLKDTFSFSSNYNNLLKYIESK
ncbi:DUF4476 domain-containing protein [Fluviicola sp. SGL-29]|nr:DUF4476 domain-containing protein [Fluviicola sp. SGL-29]